MKVRPGRPDDALALAQIHVSAWQEGYRGLLPDALLAAQSLDHRLPQWTAWLQAPDTACRTIVVVEDAAGMPAGFVFCGPGRQIPSLGEVYAIYVRPDGFGQGRGQHLLAAGETWLWDQGYPEAYLWVLRHNDRARRFYAAAGWRPDGDTQEEQALGVTLHEVRYRRRSPRVPV